VAARRITLCWEGEAPAEPLCGSQVIHGMAFSLCVLCDLLFNPDRSQQIRSVAQHVLMMSFEQKIAKIAKD
jgi:hypothetical protein